ncbi:AAA domain-containing protein [Solimonas aquatica]|uniref:AAA domain-containing protein n=1 Tax=Solimonas aquatica TaxID=489703 RepID=A0A1H9BD57_9GAMM|nr:LuxR C-terminal-related transcriptional regulator [Solimonas aquatica]SEP86661.1 AAA domain-containing protein [Solimonas aquatica]
MYKQAHPPPPEELGEGDPPSFAFEMLRLPVSAQVLDATGLRQKLLTVVAPAGYGKSVLLAMLRVELLAAGQDCAWLALDERAAGIGTIVQGLGRQLQTPDSRWQSPQTLLGGGDSAARGIESLLALLRKQNKPLTLFIDNLHFCRDPMLETLLDGLCFRSGAAVRLVFSSTQELRFNRTRARLEGLLRQLGASELAFGPAQVRAMLGETLCKRLDPDAVARIVARTEGWPAAVRLMQIALTTSKQPRQTLQAMAGSDEELAGLLDRHVFSKLSIAAREFLLRVGQLRVFSSALCREVSGDPDAQSYLDALLARNIFVIPLDRQHRWFRLHTLLREFLLREAERSLATETLQSVRLRAAQWCEQQAQWHDAMDYALAAGSHAKAAAILARIAPWFVRKLGEAPRFIQWVETLQRAGQQADPEVDYWYAWALAFHRRYDDARQHIRRMETRLDINAPLQRRLAIMLASIEVFTDNLTQAQTGVQRWLAQSTADDDPFSRTGAHCIETNCHASSFAFSSAHQANQAAKASAFQAQSAYANGWAFAYGALIPIYEGRYAQAYAELRTALDAARSELGEDGITGTLALLAARCAVAMGRDEDARALLHNGLAAARSHGFLEATACGLEAAVALWGGAEDDAYAPLTLRLIADAYPPRLSVMLSCFLIQRLVAMDRREEAHREAEHIGLNSPRSGTAASWRKLPVMRDLLLMTDIALRNDDGHLQAAQRLMVSALKSARADGRLGRCVELLLLQARLAGTSQTSRSALRSLLQAIRLAAPGRIMRPFLDQKATVSTLLGHSEAKRWALVTQDEHSFFKELCQRCAPKAPSAIDTAQIMAPPTPRELEILRLVEAGLSNQQISDRLSVSLATIKWHLQNLYAKLGISNRSAALARAKAALLL